MPEKVKKLKKKAKPSKYKRGLFFIVLILIAGIVVWYAIDSRPQELETKLEGITDTRVAAVICWEVDCFSVNKKGEVIDSAPLPSGTLLFRIDDVSDRERKERGEEAIPPDTLAELLFLRSRTYEDFSIFVTHAETEDPGLKDFDLHTKEEWAVKINIDANANSTLVILDRTLQELATSTIATLEYIDLRIPSRVFYKTR